ncbi:MAG: hypothetical protein OXP69_13705 [Spirochaetaceae bacterium]|nr:hypothetical protein [Spirochaetaceae bacterium]
MASITIRRLSDESKERLRKRAERSGCSLEALVRSILDQAAHEPIESTPPYPYNLMAVVEPGEDIEPYIREHDQKQRPVDL